MSSPIKAQVTNPTQGLLFTPQLTLHQPFGDLGDRFEGFASVGMDVSYKTKSQLLIGINYDWWFGNSLKEVGTFSEITSTSQQIIDNSGNFSIVRLGLKGHTASLNVGYIYPINKAETNSGILVSVGAGFMHHKLDIFSAELKVPQINGEYIKGYDKLTYGFATRQFIGYQYLVSHNRYHIRAGIELNQGFTQGRRTWDFNANKSGLDDRLDLTTSLKFGVIVPVFTKKAEDEEFFID